MPLCRVAARAWLVGAVCVWVTSGNAGVGVGVGGAGEGAAMGPLAAQPPGERVALPETMKLSRLVDLTSEVTGQTYSYAPADMEAMVTLRVPAGLTREQIPGLLDHILAARGFTTVRTPGSPVVSVVKLDQAAGLAATGPFEPGAAFVTQTIKANHLPAKELAEAFKTIVSKPGGTVTVIGDSNLIAVSDFTGRLEEVVALAARLDVPDATVTREIPLSFVTAQQAVTTLTQIVAKREAAGGRKLKGDVVASSGGNNLLLICPPESEEAWKDLISVVDRREPVETRTYSPRYYGAKDVAKLLESTVHAGSSSVPSGTVGSGAGGGGSDDRFRVVVDDLTGSLIVTATAAQHERITALIERLDSNERSPTPVRAFPIKNRPVNELLATLQQLIAAGALEASASPAVERADVSAGASQFSYRPPFPTPGISGETLAPPATNPAQTNAAIPPAANNSQLSQSSIVRGVTAGARPAISLTADQSTNTLIAIGEPRVLSQLEALLKTLDVRQPQVMLEAVLVSLTDSEALSLGVELENIIGFGDTTIKLASLFGLSVGGPLSGTVPVGPGLTGVVLNPGEFGAVVKALESLNKGKSLSNPQLLVTNNEQAVFSSVLQQPITQQTRSTTDDTTFSYGGSDSAGTTISVKPQIAQGDHLVLTYSIKLSNFVGTSDTAGLPPPKQENSVDSVATIPDGFTIAVGGLDIYNETESESRIPIIGEIPVIGELFKSRNTGNGRTRFFVFIRATVLRHNNFEDLKFLSARETTRFQVDDGWPEVEPRMIR